MNLNLSLIITISMIFGFTWCVVMVRWWFSHCAKCRTHRAHWWDWIEKNYPGLLNTDEEIEEAK